MKRNKYDRWLRVLALSFALLTGGGRMAWGQEKPEIKLTWNEEEHNKVHTEEKIIFVNPENKEGRVLSIPELNLNNRKEGDNSYNWFVHWYIINDNGGLGQGTIAYSQISRGRFTVGDRGGHLGVCNVKRDSWNILDNPSYVTHDYFVKVRNTNGLIWSNTLKEKQITPKIVNGEWSDGSYQHGLGIDASTIKYTLPENYTGGDIICCDISVYTDDSFEESTEDGIKGTYKEPTLLKRYKYMVKQAQESPSFKESLETYDVYYPRNASSINLSMPYTPDNYFWQDKDGNIHQGLKFEYQINGGSWHDFHLVTKNAELELQQNQKIENKDLYSNKENIVLIKVKCAIHSGEESSPVVKYILNPIDNAEFMLEKDLTKGEDNDRWPRGNSKKYEQIGIVSFDQNQTVDKITQGHNMSSTPLGSIDADQITTYGFIRKDGKSLLDSNNKCYTSYPGMYGLFRSANGDYSKHESQGFESRYYKWVPMTGEGKNYYAQKAPLYDRTYHVEKKHGYFYYVDATDEPGMLVSMPINGGICANTELTVTGWLADMTRPNCNSDNNNSLPLAPNLNVLLKGVNENNEEKLIHWFTTGDALTDYRTSPNSNASNADISTSDGRKTAFNINLMQWQQFHYKFVVPEEKLQGCTRFYLEVQNNEPHTDGADYAIDDIRIFKTKPQVRLVQAGNLCDTEIKSVRFVTDYDVALANLGLINQLPEYSVTKDEVSKLPEDHSFRQWLEKQNNQDDILRTFTKIYYSLYKSDKDGNVGSLVKIDYSGDGEGEIYRVSYISTNPDYMEWTGTGVTEGFVSSAEIPIKEGELVPDQYYKARLSMAPPAENDDVSSPCALVGDPFQLIVANKIYDIVNQENQSVDLEDVRKGEVYTLKGKLSYKESDVSTEFKEIESPKFDWFIGDLDEFEASGAINFDGKSYSIKEALIEMNNPNEKDKGNSIKELLTKKLGVYNKDKNPSGRLVFGTSSFEYYAIKKYQTVIALASQYQSEEISIEKKKLFCTDPVVIPLGGTPPTITPGDPDVPEPDPTDPEDPDNPQPDKDPETDSYVRSVRVGLIQLQDMAKGGGTLRIPIHARKSRDNEMFYADKDNVNIILRETSDKEAQSEKGKSIATLAELVDKNVQKATWSDTYLKIKFSSDDVAKMREGFWYMVEIPYGVCDREVNSLDKLHFGSFKLTLKIVPEYVTWVGREKEMHNWNNDDLNHWRRSNDNELYTKDVANKNGSHNEAYTPMRFTKVTIHGKATSDEKVGDAYAAYPHLYVLEKNTESQKKDPNNVLLNMDPSKYSNEIGTATKNIEYDLLADPDYEVELNGNLLNPLEKHSYACVRFYGNACDEIYIKPESEILHTEYLTYNKAHVDYEMDPNRWYMLASPLKGVVSGDMYLPTGKNNIGKYARQETPAFGDIYYNTTDYTRWEPAVYMRGWKNSSVDVIYPNGVAQYGESAKWSNLYNDVDVSFAPGIGFSIGTKTTRGDKVLFRLPKADTKYSYYYSNEGESEDSKTITKENRQDNGHFYFSPNEKGYITSLKVKTTGMFGNPFMSHLNMEEFFNRNKSKNDTYYILDGNTTITNILDVAGTKYVLSTDSNYDPNFVAPLQSFIKYDLEEKDVEFTTAMIAKAPTSGKKVGLRSATAAASEKTLPQLYITASRGGVHNTALVAGLVTASDSYIEGEDAALLINEEVAAPQVYTLAGNQMTAINVTPELKDIPVGIYGKDASPVELSFKLSGDMQNVTLVDKQSGKVYPVTDGLTLTVSGNTSGRYFLNGSIATSNEVIARNEIVCYANGNGQIVVSSVDPLTRISVYSVSGQRLRYLDNLNMQTVYVKDLAPGIYIVKAESVTLVCSEKMEVK